MTNLTMTKSNVTLDIGSGMSRTDAKCRFPTSSTSPANVSRQALVPRYCSRQVLS